MFCSKCGKEVQEGTAFCSSCGNPINSYAQANTAKPLKQSFISVRKNLAATAPDEYKKKNIVLTVYLIITIMNIGFWLSVVLTKLSIFPNYLINVNNSSTESLLSVIEANVISSNLWVMFVLFLMVIVTEIIGLWVWYKKRAFSFTKKHVRTIYVVYSFLWLIFPFLTKLFFYHKCEHLDVSPTFLFYFIVFLMMFVNILYIFLFYKAAECEENNVFNEQRRNFEDTNLGSWVCGNCKSINSKNEQFCKNCGEYK